MLPEKKYSLFLGKILGGYNFVNMLYGAAYMVFMNERGLDGFSISIIFAISSLSYAIFDYPSGNIADRYGRKKTAALGFLIWGIGLIGFSLSNIVFSFAFFTVISSLGVSLISGTPQSWYVDKLKEIGKIEYKNRVIPILSGALSIFSAFGAFVASFATGIKDFNVSTVLLMAGIFSLLIAPSTFIFFKDNYGERQANTLVKDVIISTKKFFNDKSMKSLLLFYILRSIPLTSFLLVWQLYALNDVGVRSEHIGIFLVGFMIVQSIAGFLSSKLLSKFPRMTNFKLTVYGGIINVLAFVLILIFGANIILFIISASILEFGIGLEYANAGAWMHDIIPSEKRSTYLSALSAINSGSNFILVLFLGLAMDLFGRSSVWIVAIIAQSISLMYLALILRKLIVKTKGLS